MRDKILTVFSIVLLAVPLALWILWIRIFDQANDQASRVALYEAFLPEYLHGRYASPFMSILFCAISFFISVILLSRKERSRKLLNIIVLVLSFFLAVINLWTLL